MATKKIEYEDKVDLQIWGSVPDKNKVKAEDMNEIKDVVNNNEKELVETQTKLEKVEKEFDDYAIHGQASGEFIHLTDSAKSSCEVDLKGNVKQETRSGKNLWNDTSIENKKVSELTNTQISMSDLKLEAGDYRFKLFFTDGTYAQADVNVLLKNSENATLKIISINSYATLTEEEAEQIVSGVCFTNATGLANYANKTITGLMLTKGTTAVDKYEKYGASPSLNYPATIFSCGNNTNEYNEENYVENLTINSDATIIESNSYNIIMIPVKPNTVYTFSRKAVENSTANIVYGISSEYPAVNKKSTYNILKYDVTELQIRTEEDTKYILIRKQKNNTDDNLFVEAKIEKGETATSFSIFGQGSVKVTSCNRNFFDINLRNSNGTTQIEGNGFKLIKSNNRIANFYFEKPLKPGKYCFSSIIQKNNIDSSSDSVGMSFKGKSQNDIGNKTYYLANNVADIEVELTEDLYSLRFFINNSQVDNATVIFNDVQLEIDKKSDYQEHEENSVIVPIQQEMFSGFDRENKKEVHNWLTVTLDGVQNIARYKHKTIENEERSFFQFNITGKGNGFSGGADSIYCDKLKAFEGAANNAINQECIWNEEGQYFYISINKSRLETDDTEGMNKFLQENPMQVYCTRAETLELDLTQEQIEALEKLDEMQTYKNITNITTDSIAILDIDYKKDLETWQKQQDDRITALEELLSTTQTSAMLVENLENDLLKEVE